MFSLSFTIQDHQHVSHPFLLFPMNVLYGALKMREREREREREGGRERKREREREREKEKKNTETEWSVLIS